MTIKEQLLKIIESCNAKQFHRKLQSNSVLNQACLEFKETYQCQSTVEAMFCIVHDQLPNKCKCGEKAVFNTFYKGYRQFCSLTCLEKKKSHGDKIKEVWSDKDKLQSMLEKKRETTLERFGVDNVAKIESVQVKIRETNLARYGCEYVTQSTEIREKMIVTMKENHGVAYPFQSEELRKKAEETYITNHGCENKMQHARDAFAELNNGLNPFQIPEIVEKKNATMLEKYGVIHPLQNETILQKMQETVVERYGVSNIMQLPGMSEKMMLSKTAKYGHPSTISTSDMMQEHVDKIAVKHGYSSGQFTNISQIPEIHAKKLESGYNSKDYVLPSGKVVKIQGYEDRFLDKALTALEEDYFDFSGICFEYSLDGEQHYYFPDFFIPRLNSVIEVKSQYTFYADIEKNIAKSNAMVDSGQTHIFCVYGEHDQYLTNDVGRQRLKEMISDFLVLEYHDFGEYIVDFYLPDFSIAVVYRSVFFTSDAFHEKGYFQKMQLYFDEKGIRCLFVDNTVNLNIWYKTLLSKVSKPVDRIYARKCSIREVNGMPATTFLNNNHIQGNSQSSIRYGLYCLDELVAIMCFNRFRNGIGKDRGEDAYELVRYATSKNVVGGASKLLSYFCRVHMPKLVYSYSDNAISTGNMYRKLGFSLESELSPSYKYLHIDDQKLKHRFSYRKGALEDKLEIYDSSLSEAQLMRLNGFVRYYDCGKRTWVKQY